MDVIHVGIISSNRKLRFSLRTLLVEEGGDAVDLVCEGLSLYEFGWKKLSIPDVVLIDMDHVSTFQDIYLAYAQEIFPRAAVLLLYDETFPADKSHPAMRIAGLSKQCTALELLTAVFRVVQEGVTLS
ncbi:hypothetical protein [Sphingobacterium suaedae]|uniref:Response regulatory domain-containing protein n=1 Tax=Sphingobacterium suaedae TaxID=1686402 RepID=A0ABW5KG92_9SPHI